MSFHGARYYGTDTLELIAHVSTDKGVSHRCGRSEGETDIWKEMGRVYTPDQTEKVVTLLNYYEPIARKTVEDWLTEHNFSFPAGGKMGFSMSVNKEMVVSSFNFSLR